MAFTSTLLDSINLLDPVATTLIDPATPPTTAPVTPTAPDPGTGITPIPVGTTAPQTLIWKGGTSDNDPTQASNWDPQVAPQMAADQTLVMNDGKMNLDSGNLAANELNISTAADKTATIQLKDHGSLDVNIPDTAIPHVNIDMVGGGEATTNIFTGPTGDPNFNISIDGKLDLQANMSFGKLTTQGSGTTFLQGDSQINGTTVKLNTKLDGFGSIELASAANSAGHIEFKDNLPVGLTLNVLDHTSTTANGVKFDSTSTTPGGPIQLQDAFAEIVKAATSYTTTGSEIDLYSNGTKFDALNITAFTGSGPLNVGVANGHTFIYNSAASSIPFGSSSNTPTGSMALIATDNTITALPMHA